MKMGQITNIKDVKVGHYITFVSTRGEELSRRFYKINIIGDNFKYYAVHHNRIFNENDRSYDTVIDNLFQHHGDEVFETLEDCICAYPEEFLK